MERISMLKIKEVFRLKYEAGLSGRKIGRALNISHTVVNDYLRIFRKKKLSYDTFKDLNHQEIIETLFGKPEINYKYPVPDWGYVETEMRIKGVTLELLHEEYRVANPDGYYGYTWFCNNYRKYSRSLNPSMKQTHKAGEKLFIDFSGMTFPVTNPKTGEIKNAEIFVAVSGASGYPFVKALPSQKIHMPASHQKHLEWTPGRILNWGLSVGTNTSNLLKTIMERKPHPEMGFRACLGIMREYSKEKEKGMTEEELERVSAYIVSHNRIKVKQIKFAIKHYEPIVQKEDDDKHSLFTLSNHTNIRGGNYYAD